MTPRHHAGPVADAVAEQRHERVLEDEDDGTPLDPRSGA